MAYKLSDQNIKVPLITVDQFRAPKVEYENHKQELYEKNTEVYSKLKTVYDNLDPEADTELRGQIYQYIGLLDKSAQQMVDNKPLGWTRKIVNEANRLYSSKVLPITTAIDTRNTLAKEQADVISKDPNSHFDVDYRTMSVTDFMKSTQGKPAIYNQWTANTLIKKAAETAKAMNDRHYIEQYVKNPKGFYGYIEKITQDGYDLTPNDLAELSKVDGFANLMRQIDADIDSSTVQLDSGAKANIRRQAMEAALNQFVGKKKLDLEPDTVAQFNARMQLQKDELAFEKQKAAAKADAGGPKRKYQWKISENIGLKPSGLSDQMTFDKTSPDDDDNDDENPQFTMQEFIDLMHQYYGAKDVDNLTGFMINSGQLSPDSLSTNAAGSMINSSQLSPDSQFTNVTKSMIKGGQGISNNRNERLKQVLNYYRNMLETMMGFTPDELSTKLSLEKGDSIKALENNLNQYEQFLLKMYEMLVNEGGYSTRFRINLYNNNYDKNDVRRFFTRGVEFGLGLDTNLGDMTLHWGRNVGTTTQPNMIGNINDEN